MKVWLHNQEKKKNTEGGGDEFSEASPTHEIKELLTRPSLLR